MMTSMKIEISKELVLSLGIGDNSDGVITLEADTRGPITAVVQLELDDDEVKLLRKLLAHSLRSASVQRSSNSSAAPTSSSGT